MKKHPDEQSRRCLEWIVPNETSCGELNKPDAMFCEKCGKKLYAAMDAAEQQAWAEQFRANLPKDES